MAYANKYYDPEKAHEYYMRTRQLKGYANRYGGARGNGTSAASSGAVLQKNTPTTTTGRRLELRQQQEQVKTNAAKSISKLNSDIADLKLKLSRMSLEDRKKHYDTVYAYTENIRKQINSVRNNSSVEIESLKNKEQLGTTSGFNEKGNEAAKKAKEDIEKELEDGIKQINKKIDDDMLDEIEQFYRDVRASRENGIGYNKNKLEKRLQKYRIRAQTSKAITISDAKKKAQKDYSDALDKIRNDETNLTSYDKRKLQEQKQAEAERKRIEREKARIAREKEREAELERKRVERERRKAKLEQERERKRREREQERERKRREREAAKLVKATKSRKASGASGTSTRSTKSTRSSSKVKSSKETTKSTGSYLGYYKVTRGKDYTRVYR